MKNTSTKLLSLFLALVTALSCFAMIPVAAETAEGTATNTAITEAAPSSELLSIDFDGNPALPVLTKQALVNELKADTETWFVQGAGEATTITATGAATLKNAKGDVSFVRVDNGELAVNRAQLSVKPNVSFALTDSANKKYTVTWGDTTAEGAAQNTFYDLFNGDYFDENGNLLTEYYFDFDYTHQLNRRYYKENGYATSGTSAGHYDNSRTYTAQVDTDNDGDAETVSYKISTQTRGESIMTVMSTGGYTWITKVTQDGWIYVNSESAYSDAKFDLTKDPATSGSYDVRHFSVTKTVDDVVVDDHIPMTAELWNKIKADMVTNAEKDEEGNTTLVEAIKAKDSAGKWTVDTTTPDITPLSTTQCYRHSSDMGYKLEEGVTYNIRYTFSVGADGKIILGVYVRPDSYKGGAWQSIGTVGYTPGNAYKSSKRNTGDEPDVVIQDTYRKFYAIRFTEDQNCYMFDNMKFCTWAEKCEGNSHVFLVGSAAKLKDDGKTLTSVGTCQSCGKTFALTGSLKNETLIEHHFGVEGYNYTTDSETKRAEGQTAAKNAMIANLNPAKASGAHKIGSTTVTDDLIKAALTGHGLGIKCDAPAQVYSDRVVFNKHFTTNPNITSNRDDFWMEFDSTFTGLGSSTTSTSLITYQRHDTDYNILIRLVDTGEANGSSSSDDVAVKLYHKTHGSTWSNIDSSYTLCEGIHYTFKLHMRPLDAEFDLYIYTDNSDGSLKFEKMATGALSTDSTYTVDDDYYKPALGYSCYTSAVKDTNKTIVDYNAIKIGNYPAFRIFANTTTEEIKYFKIYRDSEGSFDSAQLIHESTSDDVFVPYIEDYDKVYLRYQDELPCLGSDGMRSNLIHLYNKDNITQTKPYYMSFDFMVDEYGQFTHTNPNATDSSAQFWSVIGGVATLPNAKAPTFDKWLLLGGVDSTGDGVFDKMFLFSEKFNYGSGNNGYTTEENTGFQTTAEGGSTYYTDENALYEVRPGEWIRITAIVEPVYGSLLVYANNKLVVSVPESGIVLGNDPYLRIGDGFRKFIYKWNVTNIKTGVITNADAFDMSNNISDVVWSTDFNTQDTALRSEFGDVSMTNMTVEKTANGYTRIKGKLVESTNEFGQSHFNVSATYRDENGNDIHALSGKKYALSTTFALSDVEYTSHDGSETLKSSNVDHSIFRLSKFIDYTQIRLLYCNATGFYTDIETVNDDSKLTSNRIYLYGSNGKNLNAFTNVENGVPAKWTKATVVVDEENDTYSIYIDDKIAYYYSTDESGAQTLTPALDLPMLVKEHYIKDDGTSSSKIVSTKYKDIETSYDSTSVNGYYNKNYIRFFQNVCDAYVKDASISLIKDEKVEYIGAQTRNADNDETTFDLRFVFGVDDLYVEDIGYDVRIEGSDKFAYKSSEKTVYATLKVTDGMDINSVNFKEGNYLSCFQITDIDKTHVESIPTTFIVTPYRLEHSKSEPVKLTSYRIEMLYTALETTFNVTEIEN